MEHEAKQLLIEIWRERSICTILIPQGNFMLHSDEDSDILSFTAISVIWGVFARREHFS